MQKFPPMADSGSSPLQYSFDKEVKQRDQFYQIISQLGVRGNLSEILFNEIELFGVVDSPV